MKFTATVLGSILLSTGAYAQNCQSDIKECPDGQTLNRNPTNNCEYDLCQGEKDCSSASTGDEENKLLCSSGMTSRDPFNNCEFEQCDDPRCEMEDYKQCPSPNLHVYVARDPKAGASGCADYLPCPGSGTPTPMSTCPLDIKTCPDGQTLNPNPSNNCEFDLCQGEKDCSSASTGDEENKLLCSSGMTSRDPFNNCEFEQCDDPRCEVEDYKQCPGPNLHVYVARDPKAGASGCADYLPCPGSVTPTPMNESSDIVAFGGILASVAAAIGFSMAM